MIIRDVCPKDIPDITKLNNLEKKWVGLETQAFFSNTSSEFFNPIFFKLAEDNRQLLGFMDVMNKDSKYPSRYFEWFKKNELEDFLYVDRVVVSPSARRQGIARGFYDLLKGHGKGTPIVCEISIIPYNEISDVFHNKLGFREVGQIPSSKGGICSLRKLDY